MILLKQGEMILKGGNRRSFEQRLEEAVRRRTAKYGAFKVYSKQSVVYVEQKDSTADEAGAFDELSRQFGVVSLSLCKAAEKSPEAILSAAKESLKGDFASAKTFKVETKRADKSFSMTSIQLSQRIGGALSELFPDVTPEMRNPDLTVHIDVREDAAFVSGAPLRGAGGLPPGSSGKAVALLSGGIDSPVAIYLAAKRGLRITPIHFHSFPYTSPQAKQKVVDLASVLTRYCEAMTLYIVPFTEIQEEIAKNCPDELGTIITRRFMTRIAERAAFHIRADALVTGENLGQVASQTIQGLAASEDAAQKPILRPLLCFDKQEITDLALKIGTYGISSLPFEDCCTVFTPRRPVTKPRLSRVREAEAALDTDVLTKRAYEAIERLRIF